jgi:hypothetical protein
MTNINCSSDSNALLNDHSSKSIMFATLSQASMSSQQPSASCTLQQSNSSNSTPSPTNTFATINSTNGSLSQQQFESYSSLFQSPFYELEYSNEIKSNEETIAKSLSILQSHGASSSASFLTPCLLFDRNNAQLINNHNYSLQQTNSNSSSSSDLSQTTKNNSNPNSDQIDVLNQSLLLFKQKLSSNQVGLPNQTPSINLIQQANPTFHAVASQFSHPNQHFNQMITLNKKKLIENDLILKHARELRRAQLHYKPY